MSHLMSLSGTIFNLKFQVYLMLSCGDRNQGEQTEEMIKNSHSVQGDTAFILDITNPVIFLISQNHRFITLVCQQRCILVL